MRSEALAYLPRKVFDSSLTSRSTRIFREILCYIIVFSRSQGLINLMWSDKAKFLGRRSRYSCNGDINPCRVADTKQVHEQKKSIKQTVRGQKKSQSKGR
ncbi:hypothetical protein KC19_7G128700 [Ceratodon purpureus]|uniref:Uncharacterized protein n=1 Tax=Ceratodon purpureus TaxID=3225 RepID=A0A8T0H7J3_CERPU|nr:hypothetical protein KC19_7G128700 [Ceratodon purpureus]